MTVSTPLSRISYTEDGASTVFPVPFRFLTASDLVVERILAGVVTVLTLTADYTVAGADISTGGSITRTAATNGAMLRIRRATPRSQSMVYTVGDDFPAESHERALDRQMLISQEADSAFSNNLDRSLRVPDGVVAPTVPDPAANPGKVLGAGAAGVMAWVNPGGADSALRADIALIGDQLNGYQRDPGGTVFPLYHFIRNQPRSIYTQGATSAASGLTNRAALLATLALCVADGRPLLIEDDEFQIDMTGLSVLALDLTRTIRGAKRAIAMIARGGAGQSCLTLSNATTMGLQFASTSDWDHGSIEGFMVRMAAGHALNGPLITLGRNDFADPLNVFAIRDVWALNPTNNAAAEAWRFNYIAPGSTAHGLVGNCYADGLGNNNGTAGYFRQVENMALTGGSLGNATVAMKFDNGFSFGVKAKAMTLENTDYCVDHRTSLSGGHAWSACQLSNVLYYPIRSSACNPSTKLYFDPSNNFSMPDPLVDPANCKGVHIIDNRGLSTPAMPASGVYIPNTTGRYVRASAWSSGITQVLLRDPDGSTQAIPIVPTYTGEHIIPPEGAIGFVYTVTPALRWRNAGI